jgi:hypothetical protein
VVGLIEFLRFDSVEGDALLVAYLASLSPEEFAAFVRLLA